MRRALLCLVLATSPVLAQGAKDPEAGSPNAGAPKGPNAEGEYGGVQPGEGKKPEPGKRPKKPARKGTLSWIGFETKSGGADVFFQSAAPFEVNQRIDKGALIVTLAGLTRLGHNTWRPIDTRFFDTSLARITAKKKGKNIEVRIVFKNAKDATQGALRTATEGDGMFYAYLSFSGGGTSSTPAKEPEK